MKTSIRLGSTMRVLVFYTERASRTSSRRSSHGKYFTHPKQLGLPLILAPPLQPPRTKQGSHGLGRTIINRKAKEAKVDRKTLKYTEEAENLRSVTHERDLDEFLNNASLADADFTAGECPIQAICRLVIHVFPRSSYGECQGHHNGIYCYQSTEERLSTFRRRRARRKQQAEPEQGSIACATTTGMGCRNFAR